MWWWCSRWKSCILPVERVRKIVNHLIEYLGINSQQCNNSVVCSSYGYLSIHFNLNQPTLHSLAKTDWLIESIYICVSQQLLSSTSNSAELFEGFFFVLIHDEHELLRYNCHRNNENKNKTTTIKQNKKLNGREEKRKS